MHCHCFCISKTIFKVVTQNNLDTTCVSNAFVTYTADISLASMPQLSKCSPRTSRVFNIQLTSQQGGNETLWMFFYSDDSFRTRLELVLN